MSNVKASINMTAPLPIPNSKSASGSTNKKTSIPILDWPSPRSSFDGAARRPSLQEDCVSPTRGFSFASPVNSIDENDDLGNEALGPAIALQPPAGTVTFRSPFAATSAGTKIGGSINISEDLSPFCQSASPRSPSGLSVFSLSSSSQFSPNSLLSTPGPATPGSTLFESGMHPFEAAFKQRVSVNSPDSSTGSDHSPRTTYFGASKAPRSPRSPLFGVNSMELAVPGVHGDNGSSSSNNQRRRSVDVGMLGSARSHQASGRTNQTDASAAAFVPPDQLRAQRAQRVHKQTRESLFAQHLTSILSHSLSLCAAGNNEYGDYDDQSSSTLSSSSRSSISSSADDTTPPAILTPSTPSFCTATRRQRLPSLPSIAFKRRLELLDFLTQWSFDANELDQDELCECACIIFECVLLMDGLDNAIAMKRIRPLLLSLRSAYHPRNAYHNFAHAVDVLQACYAFVTAMGLAPPLTVLTDPSFKDKWTREPKLAEKGAIGDVLRPMDVLALLVAAIGHDVGHPGLSNAYMVNARTPAAQVYNDKSVLENFHSVTLARMLKLHGLGHLLETENSTTEFRQVLLASVLATDMSRHFPFVGKLTELGARLRSSEFRSDNIEDDRLLLCSGLMKAADISNPTRPHNVARQWSTALLEEWAVQAQIEAKFKLPISVVILDPEERLAQAKSQVGFINLFTQPLFDAMAGVVPSFQTFADKCREGRAIWESVVLEGEETCNSRPSTSSGRPNNNTSPSSTPKLGSSSAFSSSSSASPALPASRGFSSRLPPHRAPRALKQIDATRANAFTNDGLVPLSAATSASSTSANSPRPSSLFDRSCSISSTTTAASSIFPTSVDDCMPLGDEECEGGCSSVTAACPSCARKWDREDPVTTYYGSPIDSGIWPPGPFRPPPASEKAIQV